MVRTGDSWRQDQRMSEVKISAAKEANQADDYQINRDNRAQQARYDKNEYAGDQ
jgi:hypothetical protein